MKTYYYITKNGTPSTMQATSILHLYEKIKDNHIGNAFRSKAKGYWEEIYLPNKKNSKKKR